MRSAAVLGLALLAAAAIGLSSASAQRAAGATAKPVKITAPAPGKVSVTAFAITAKHKPKLRLVGKAPATLIVVAGVAADRKHRGRYVGVVVLVSKRAASVRKTQALAAARAAFVVQVSADGADTVGPTSLRDAIAQANGGDTIVFNPVFLSSPPAAVTALNIFDAGFAAQTNTRWGDYASAAAGDSFFGDLTGPGALPPEPPPASGTFTIGLAHVFGAGPNSTNGCETITVTEQGINVLPAGTLHLTGPGGFDKTNTLTFAPSGAGVFVATSVFLFTAFGPYTESASITVSGTTLQQTGAYTLDASNDKTTAGCAVP